MLNCEYVVFVSFIAKGTEQTVCFYARDKQLADALASTLRINGKMHATEKDGITYTYSIVNVTACHL
jgi:hypothetical protein